MYVWGFSAAKASFAVLYLRIFPEGRFRIINKITLGALLAQAIENTSVVLFRCQPIRKSWDFRLEGRCYDLHPLRYAAVSGTYPTCHFQDTKRMRVFLFSLASV
ncbi:hypothetical protein M426DRAFT_321689 [Hypoxylon sp. CI-4A]|nr:hypothetical protein M426DRAFT_321689 [Hypoxylon sp. CI-4A]